MTKTTSKKITFLTPTPPDISAFGVRALSAWLKQKGHNVTCIFLPGGIDYLRHSGTYSYHYSDHVLKNILDIVAGSDVAALSFFSQYRDRALQLTQTIQEKLGIFTVWGGIHSEVYPEDGLAHADAVCISEGETVLEQLLELINIQNLDPGDVNIPGLLTRQYPDSRQPLPCIENLDALPWMDMGPDDHYLLDPIEDQIVPMTIDRMKIILPLMPGPNNTAVKVFRLMTSRGCPHQCTYCANHIKAKLYPGKQYLRFRSPEHVIGEIKKTIDTYPFIEGIHFFDDVFTAMNPPDLKMLCHQMKTEIKLPWYAQVSPSILTRDQLDMFIDSGLVFIEMGIQTGSSRIRGMYRRPESNQTILRSARLIYEYKNKLLKPHYHVILDNPWETRQDVRDTLDLLTRIPGKFKLCLASLTFYPGTELATAALKDGFLTDIERQVYRKPFFVPKGRYLNYLVYITDISWIPRGFIRFMGNKPALLLDKPFLNPFFDFCRYVTDKLRLIGKGLTAVTKGQWHRIRNYFKRIR